MNNPSQIHCFANLFDKHHSVLLLGNFPPPSRVGIRSGRARFIPLDRVDRLKVGPRIDLDRPDRFRVGKYSKINRSDRFENVMASTRE
jgi:hypothetical protein